MEKELPKENVIQDQLQSVETPERKKITPKLALLIIVGVIVILLIAFYAIAFFTKKAIIDKISDESKVDQIVYSTEMKFATPEITVTPGKVTTVDIEIDTHGKAISGATIAIDYNPNILEKVTLTQFKDPKSAISNAFEVATNQDKDGQRILFLNMPQSTPEQKGKGIIARLTFTPKLTNVTQTEITFSGSSALNTRIDEPQIGIIKNTLLLKF